MTPRVKHVFDLMGLGGSMKFAPNTKEALKILKKGAKV
jgi:anti-anti-sigma regulatory factor